MALPMVQAHTQGADLDVRDVVVRYHRRMSLAFTPAVTARVAPSLFHMRPVAAARRGAAATRPRTYLLYASPPRPS